jgi:hypothetical protein
MPPPGWEWTDQPPKSPSPVVSAPSAIMPHAQLSGNGCAWAARPAVKAALQSLQGGMSGPLPPMGQDTLSTSTWTWPSDTTQQKAYPWRDHTLASGQQGYGPTHDHGRMQHSLAAPYGSTTGAAQQPQSVNAMQYSHWQPAYEYMPAQRPAQDQQWQQTGPGRYKLYLRSKADGSAAKEQDVIDWIMTYPLSQPWVTDERSQVERRWSPGLAAKGGCGKGVGFNMKGRSRRRCLFCLSRGVERGTSPSSCALASFR